MTWSSESQDLYGDDFDPGLALIQPGLRTVWKRIYFSNRLFISDLDLFSFKIDILVYSQQFFLLRSTNYSCNYSDYLSIKTLNYFLLLDNK